MQTGGGDNKLKQIVDGSLTTVTADDLEGVTSIRDYAFNGCSNLTEITLPSSLTSIGQYAIQSCRSLTTITIPETVTRIRSYAFQNCRKIKSIAFGTNSQLQTIGDYTFGNCVALTTITIPESVTSIGNGVFSGCTSLQTVIYKGQAPNILYKCFYNCSSITKYDFRNCTTVPTLANVNTLGHATGCQIIIPDALYDDWTTATNWVSLTGVTFVKASEYTE